MSSKRPTSADEWLDEVLPEDLDWPVLVSTYPRISMGIAVAAGFWIGLRHGSTILQAVSDHAGKVVTEQVDEFLGQQR